MLSHLNQYSLKIIRFITRIERLVIKRVISASEIQLFYMSDANSDLKTLTQYSSIRFVPDNTLYKNI